MYRTRPDGTVFLEETGQHIPNDPLNRDWKLYQEWLSEGNTPGGELVDLDALRRARKDDVEARLRFMLALGLDYKGIVYDIDNLSRSNLAGVILFIQTGQTLPPGFTWRSKDNQNVPLTAPEIVELGTIAMGYVSGLYIKSHHVKDAIDIAHDAQTIRDVDISLT